MGRIAVATATAKLPKNQLHDAIREVERRNAAIGHAARSEKNCVHVNVELRYAQAENSGQH